VELIIVMAILAILAGLAVPKFSGILDDSKNKANEANKRLISEAAELYLTNESGAKGSDLNGEVNSSHKLITKKYLKEIPKDPRNNSNYTITANDTDGVTAVAPTTTTGY
jgi:type IV pilus assembly protein PilA